MAFLQNGVFCNVQEYEQNRLQSIHETDLINGDIYSLNILLKSEERQAAKLVASPLKIKHHLGFTVIKFVFLDGNLEPTIETREKIHDGLINNAEGFVVEDLDTNEKIGVVQAFFKDYFDDQFGKLLFEKSELTLVN